MSPHSLGSSALSADVTSDRLRRYAELAVRVGANVGEGQYVLRADRRFPVPAE
jgi:hypothetical protein